MIDPVVGLVLAMMAFLYLYWDSRRIDPKAEDYHTIHFHKKTFIWLIAFCIIIGGIGNFIQWFLV